ncbi:alpha/beta hydrolase [Cryobacterium tepidiphilum]|uniref:Phospholipase n=1 Tax=Cryobacterium tepidiphilum TaxID=2486026 RepID=A0A3M8LPE3_9MICO|nr:alpha/beta hydrolase-fold protein [Cryobacterium tepidiphilum]RNE67417.1 phospholipase [Cryobacterium tepidiphilum]
MDNSGRIEPIDTDAVLWSASERDRAGRPLLLILHGFGSHEGDLFALTPHLPLRPVMASLRAPLSAGSGGWAWFPLDRDEGSAAVDAATLGVLQWLDALVTQPTSVGLLGFSQGGVMALQLMRHAPDRFAFAVQLSGFVAPGPRDGDDRLAARRPPVFWGRGTVDEVIPGDAVDWTQDWLPDHATLTERIYEGMPHTVSDAELRDVVGFLREQYPA